ncbi:hypothetical protein V1264_015619 [Littorina saxatilis]|uniref:Uncharacterized protein n=1 Tax=Littorina saxatilis TaxID=31220 RepID=A0AAN9BK21_9CAEN
MSNNQDSSRQVPDNAHLAQRLLDSSLQEDSPEDQIDGAVSASYLSSQLAQRDLRQTDNFEIIVLPIQEQGPKTTERSPARARSVPAFSPPAFLGHEVHAQPITNSVFNPSSVIRTSEEAYFDLRRAVKPEYASMDARLNSFDVTLMCGMPSPYQLAEAGFYHTEKSRHGVQCFYCGAVLQDWHVDDNPWVNHINARFSCEYVRHEKGEAFAYNPFGVTPNEEQ